MAIATPGLERNGCLSCPLSPTAEIGQPHLGTETATPGLERNGGLSCPLSPIALNLPMVTWTGTGSGGFDHPDRGHQQGLQK